MIYNEDCYYAESHEWIEADGTTRRIGISDFAQDELGDIVFVELPSVGETIEAGESFGVVESIKAVSDLYAPVSGEVTAVNESVYDAPELVNQEPFDDGWFIEIDPESEHPEAELLSAEEYREVVE